MCVRFLLAENAVLLLTLSLLALTQIGDIGAITGSLVYRPSLSKNFYRVPHGIAILFTGLGCVLALSLSLGMRRANVTDNAGRAEFVEKKGEEARGDRRRGYKFQI